MNSNWKLKKDGWHKKQTSTTRGNADYFKRTPPPMRDSSGRPMKNYDEIDIAKWIEEVNEKNK
jgi:hypothetical protein